MTCLATMLSHCNEQWLVVSGIQMFVFHCPGLGFSCFFLCLSHLFNLSLLSAPLFPLFLLPLKFCCSFLSNLSLLSAPYPLSSFFLIHPVSISRLSSPSPPSLSPTLSSSFSQPLLEIKDPELKKLGVTNSKDRSVMLVSLASYRSQTSSSSTIREESNPSPGEN